MPPNISIRESIRWLPDPAEEPTSTIVLTSDRRYFVDIRILKDALSTERDPNATLPLSCLDWAIAGSSTSTPTGEPTKTHGTWSHWVDSRHANVKGLTDEGDMLPLDGNRTLETGSMVNPATNRMTAYEEVWVDEDAAGPKDYGDRSTCCAVLHLHNNETEAYGMVIRLGQYCQGVLRIGEAFAAQRWQWLESAGEGAWNCVASVGTHGMPCEIVLQKGMPLEGADIKFDGHVWQVVEVTKS